MEEARYKLREVIDSLDHGELLKIKKDIDAGGLHLKRFIHEKIKENEKKHEQYCAVCSSKIDPYSMSTFTLVFGPADFKKKASFCAVDCLKYFLKSLEELKKKGSYQIAQKP